MSKHTDKEYALLIAVVAGFVLLLIIWGFKVAIVALLAEVLLVNVISVIGKNGRIR